MGVTLVPYNCQNIVKNTVLLLPEKMNKFLVLIINFFGTRGIPLHKVDCNFVT